MEASGGRLTILVVEDDPFVRSYMNTQIIQLEYQALLAGDGSWPRRFDCGGPNVRVIFRSDYTEDSHHPLRLARMPLSRPDHNRFREPENKQVPFLL
jgi:hypothetical protein